MEKQRVDIVKSMLRFLKEELEHYRLDTEQKESLEVAKQCLESTYDIDGNDPSVTAGAMDLCGLFNVKEEVSEEVAKLAEDLKVRGNNHMKIGQYAEALALYTKAIELNPKNHVLYCNRAAAYSRLDQHWDAITDCKESIRITPTAKAYGRLGVAYSNMNLYHEAKEAYTKAHELDPTNTTYEQNLKLADEILLNESSASAQGASANPINFNNFLNNPALLNMASQMISDPAFLNMVSGMMSTGPNGDPNLDGFINVTQQLAQQMQAANPNIIQSLRQSMGSQNPPGNDGDHNKEDDTKENNQ